MLKTVLAGCFYANGKYYFTYFNVQNKKNKNIHDQKYPAVIL